MSVIIISFITLLVFLYSFYTSAKDDHYFIRKSITLEQLFNILLIGIFWSVLLGRLGYVFFHPNNKFLNPLVFFLVPYFPGISVAVGVISFFVAIIYLAKRRKIQPARLLDYISYAGLIALPCGLFANFLFQGMRDLADGVYIPLTYLLFFILYRKILFPRFIRGSLREGSLSALFLIIFSLLSVTRDVILLYQKDVLLRTEDFFSMGIFFIASFFLIRFETKKQAK